MNEPKLRILQMTTTVKGGTWFRDQVIELRDRGHIVKAVLPGDGELADWLRAAEIDVELIPLCGWRPKQLPRVALAQVQLARTIRRFRPDVVHAHLLKAHITSRIARLAYPASLLVNQVTGITHLSSPVLRKIDRATLPLVDLVIGSCQEFARIYGALNAPKTAVSHYGCHVESLRVEASDDEVRREFGIPADAPVVGMVAHMYPTKIRAYRDIGIKGHEVLIDAMPRIVSRFPDVRFVLVGDEFAGSGAYRRSLEERVRRLGMSERTFFTGQRSDVQNLLATMAILVCPSLAESASYAVIEALLMRRGVVASRVGGLPDSVQHRETGLLVPPGDCVALGDAIVELLADPPMRMAMGALGRQRVLRKFAIETTVGQIEEIYRNELRLRRGQRAYQVIG